MSTNCTHCGYRDNEVKSGSSISPRGKKITLRVVDKEDLSRDVLKVPHSHISFTHTLTLVTVGNSRSIDSVSRSDAYTWNAGRAVYDARRSA